MYALKHRGCVGDSHQDPRIPESNLEASKMPFLSHWQPPDSPRVPSRAAKRSPMGGKRDHEKGLQGHPVDSAVRKEHPGTPLGEGKVLWSR